jgi:flagellar biosynthesis protein FlhB
MLFVNYIKYFTQENIIELLCVLYICILLYVSVLFIWNIFMAFVDMNAEYGIYTIYNVILSCLELIFCFISLPFILLRHVILH